MPKHRTVKAQRRATHSNPLALELLDTRNCRELLPQFEAFENLVFGPDFAVAPETMKAWTDSGSWFCAAVTGQAVVGRQQIFSMLSVLITTCASRDLLLAGQASESELKPWTDTPLDDKPAVYLTSVISAASDHLGLMYESLARELKHFKAIWRTEFESGFSIASGPAGFSHMGRNGFRAVEGQNYRGHYPIMTIDSQSADTQFWQEVLGSEPKARKPAIRRDPTLFGVLPHVALAS